ncbi:MAG: NAD(+) diphosphatase [Desulfobacteraceae bacterium]|nr:NAD(+) diphosphatase [Desulfobacteraceae bacterium]
MNFKKSSSEPSAFHGKAYYFIFSKNNILVKKESQNRVSILCIGKKSFLQMTLNHICFLGTLEDMPCYCASIPCKELPEEYEWINLRALYGKTDDMFWTIAGYARQIYDWNMNFKFCGKCGAKTRRKKNESARVCPECSLISYPRISPAIITAVVKDDQILLARGINFPNKKMFSILAGFVEPGESLEECVKREIFEEVGVKVKNIRYFKSQPWPFPDSLMIGFTAVYESGELLIDKQEIVEAGWFKAANLPIIPGKQSLARSLIDWFVKGKI